jgi:hypothetical protein
LTRFHGINGRRSRLDREPSSGRQSRDACLRQTLYDSCVFQKLNGAIEDIVGKHFVSLLARLPRQYEQPVAAAPEIAGFGVVRHSYSIARTAYRLVANDNSN